MKRTLFRILLVVLIPVLLSQYSFPVSASENPSVSILSDKTEDKLIISIYFENVRALTGAGFQLLYNEELLIPQSFNHKSGEWENLLVGEKYIQVHFLMIFPILRTMPAGFILLILYLM